RPGAARICPQPPLWHSHQTLSLVVGGAGLSTVPHDRATIGVDHVSTRKRFEQSLPPLGAHMSISGGYFRAVERAHAAGCQCVQLFTKNNNQWRAKPISREDATAFRESLSRLGVTHPLSHTSYLLNLASPDRDLRRRSVDALVVELERAAELGAFGVVLHPGAAMGAKESVALRRVSQGLNQAMTRVSGSATILLLETTAGQGSSLGWKFEHLADLLERVKTPERFGVCMDTCHVHAAGYDLSTRDACEATFARFDETVGIPRIRAFHLNDSKVAFGSRVDRHEHIGRGTLGTAVFRFLLQDQRFRHVPMYLETPKGTEKGRDLDRVNLACLRRLARSR
ncbi:MAG TPA: deoxyribonuclease IV, partial [Pirellulaceae bacterium]